MLSVVLQALGVFVYCLVLAWLEVQIEGAHGWAANLPTWRRQPAWASERSWFFGAVRAVFRLLSGGNELTGYHLAMSLFVFASMMMPLLMTGPTPELFARCLGFWFLTLVTWDFLWFVLNPAFGVRRFHRRAIKWHPRWIGPVPAAYPFGYLFGGACLFASDGPLGLVAPAILLAATALSIAVVEGARA
jgi:hypothetical protein